MYLFIAPTWWVFYQTWRDIASDFLTETLKIAIFFCPHRRCQKVHLLIVMASDQNLRKVRAMKKSISAIFPVFLCLLLCLSFAGYSGKSNEGGEVKTAEAGQPSPWAADEVNEAVEMGLIPQFLQNHYQDDITRAEFAALAVTLYESVTGNKITGRSQFNDCSDPYVEEAAGAGFVYGIGDDLFAPDDSINRAEAAAMLARVAQAAGHSLPPRTPTFTDFYSIPNFSRAAVGAVQAAEVMNGTGGNEFSPLAACTREQAAVSILRLHTKLLVPITDPSPQTARETRDLGELAGKKLVVLTFDDGPYRATTPRLLDLLSERDVRVTFFVQGQWAEANPDIVLRAYAAGDTIGNHTYDHQTLTELTSDQILDEYYKTNHILWNLGIYNTYFRPPGDTFNPYIARLLGCPIVLNDVDPTDWASWNEEAIYQAIISGIENGGTIVQLHDKVPETTDAVIRAIDNLTPKGYAFISLEEAKELELIPDGPYIISSLGGSLVSSFNN